MGVGPPKELCSWSLCSSPSNQTRAVGSMGRMWEAKMCVCQCLSNNSVLILFLSFFPFFLLPMSSISSLSTHFLSFNFFIHPSPPRYFRGKLLVLCVLVGTTHSSPFLSPIRMAASWKSPRLHHFCLPQAWSSPFPTVHSPVRPWVGLPQGWACKTWTLLDR